MFIPKPQSLDRKSPYRYCKDRKANGERCGKVFRIDGQSSTKCRECRLANKRERRERLGDGRVRKAKYRKAPKEFWNENARKRQTEAAGHRCAVCGKTEKECVQEFGLRLVRDHLIPIRYLEEHDLGDGHLDINISMTCPSPCGGRKTSAEVKLFRGDMLGFLTDLRRWGWNMPNLKMVMQHYKIYTDSMHVHFN